MLPVQYLQRSGVADQDPHKRLMAAVLQTVVDDCRGTAYRRARGTHPLPAQRDAAQAIAYLASTDRGWPYSFENLCDALGLDATHLRRALGVVAHDDVLHAVG